MFNAMWAILLGVLAISADRILGKNITFDSDIRAYAVGNSSLYVLTDNQLHQVRHDLVQIQNKSFPRGIPPEKGTFQGVSNIEHPVWNFYVNLLVPFIENNTLITCGRIKCGYCEILDLNDISKSVHSEDISVGFLNGSSVVFLVDVKVERKTETYILAAHGLFKDECSETGDKVVTMQNTNDKQTGAIFSLSDENQQTPFIASRHNVEFVDGFQIDQNIYLLSNLERKVKLNWLKATTHKVSTFESLQAATLDNDEDRDRRLLSSSVIPGGPPIHWAGVFTGSNTSDPVNTVLAIYDITPGTGGDPDFCSNTLCVEPEPADTSKHLKPVAVVFKYNSMTSVLSVRQGPWMVFFIGTGDGQLIKLAVDKYYTSTCPRVLYRSYDNEKLFPKMHLDPVDHKHLYMVVKNQIKRVAVAECSKYIGLKDCWSTRDPFCGWCDTKNRCTFEDECSGSAWFSIPEDSTQQGLISHQLERSISRQDITLTIQVHLNMTKQGSPALACNFTTGSDVLCDSRSPDPVFPRCFCRMSSDRLPTQGLDVTVEMTVGTQMLTESLRLTNCSGFSGPATFHQCTQCVSAGCSWKNPTCSWSLEPGQTGDVCRTEQTPVDTEPEISSIEPREVSFHGRNHAFMTGKNLRGVTRVQIQRDYGCSPKESPVWNNSGSSLTFHIPSGDKGSVRICVVSPGGRCHGNTTITYKSSPICTGLEPTTTWARGRRRIVVRGSVLELVDGVSHGDPHKNMSANYSDRTLWYFTPGHTSGLTQSFTSTVSLIVANQTLTCPVALTYYPNPEFISFTSTKTGSDLRITIQKKADKLNLTKAELSVLAVQGQDEYPCDLEAIETSNTTDSVICEILNINNVNIDRLKITYGNFTEELKLQDEPLPLKSPQLLGLFSLLLLPLIVVAVVCLYRNVQKKFTVQMNQRLELLECDIRQDIRQGFVDMQTDNSDLTENVGAIPFLDFKHFASRIFFPEGGPVMNSCLRDIGQDVVKPDQACQALSALIQNQQFLTSMVHALEEQKNFSIKDKCMVASLLTVALHGELPYLTTVMEHLLVALMDQPSNSQPKLMLRRTESIVEKLLTNWMSVCLYGFLRESVGQHLFLLVHALTQQMSRGPVDSITQKALYTLNEDWLLWQAQDFSPMKLRVLFAVGTDEEVSDPLEVRALSCDTVEQVKEKILLAFKNKFGFPYNTPLKDIHLEYEQGGSFVGLEEVTPSSEVLGDATMLNTLRHYKVPDGASIKVLTRGTHRPLSPQGSLKDDQNFSTKYFHLIDPDVEQDQRQKPERKKLKLKEVHLTKLLSTKVAVHSFVENLFRTIWGTANGKAPHAVKYFFDFLDAQAENKRISDQEVTHIWKTNSLPLRFWVNILKNPQFVFDLEKTPYLEGCLNVIAQAFMDSFSLSETQLGKHAPTNKLLYAKDIPQYKQEVKSYYKQVRDQPPVTSSEFKDFLLEESRKHENEFNDSAALREIYKYMNRYFEEIKQKLEQNGAPAGLQDQLQRVKDLFCDLKSCSWD